MTSTFEKIIDLGTHYLFLARTLSVPGATLNYIGRWDGQAGTFTSVGGGVSAFSVGCVSVPGTDNVYVCGSFTTAGGSVTVNQIAYWNGSTWSNLANATVFDSNVQAMAYDSKNSLLYATSYLSTNITNRISRWNGTSWTGIAEATVNNYCKLTIDDNSNLYAGYGTILKRYLYQTNTWETLSSAIGGTISDIKYNGVDNRVYITLYIGTGASVKYYDITNSTIGALGNLGKYSRAIAFDTSNSIYVACQSPDTYQGSVVKYNGSGWDNLYNYQNTSGVLDLEIDANNNIFGFANAGSLVIGTPPYTTGNWQGISGTSNIIYGGPRTTENGLIAQSVVYQLNDNVRLKANTSQQGVVVRLHPLGAQNAIVVKWSNGPLYTYGNMMGYFGATLDNEIELVP